MLERLLEIFKPISNAIQELRENWNISEEDQQRYQTKRFYLLIYFNLLVIGALTILYILFAYFLSAAVFVHRNMLFYTLATLPTIFVVIIFQNSFYPKIRESYFKTLLEKANKEP